MDLELWNRRKRELKMSFRELSDKTGISVTALKVIFLGKTESPRLVTVIAIERALGLTDALTPEEYTSGLRYTKNTEITADEEEILDLYHEIIKKHGADKHDTVVKVLDMLRGEK